MGGNPQANMRLLARRRGLLSLAACGVGMAMPQRVWAQAAASRGVTADEVLLGRSAGITGALAVRMKPATEAMLAAFGASNDAGGVQGRRVRLLTLDDGNDATRAAENTRRLIDDDGVFAMFANSGTPQTVAAVKVIETRGVPLIGSSSGADSVQAHHPLVFHYKASYGAELRRIAGHLQLIGMQRVAVVHSPDPTGREGQAQAVAALASVGLKAQAVVSTAPADVARLFAGAEPPQAVVLVSLAAPGAAFFKALVEQPGQRPQVFAWSIIGVEAIFKEVGERIRGLVVSQVFPSPASTRTRLAVDYQALMKARGLADGGYPGFEGYVAARLMLEALQRAGRTLTRPGLVQALQGMRSVDLGGDLVSFGPKDHVGRSFVELTMVGADGRFVR
jgi:branched-chain amino acid transport system substrate-binding protein